MPNLMPGSIASSITGRLVTYLPAYDSIATVTVATAQSTISFTSIPATYKHLQLRFIGRSTRSATQGYVIANFNSDTGSNYAYHTLESDGSNPYGNGSGAVSYPTLWEIPGANATSNIFGAGVVDILDYANTNKYKTIRALQGDDKNGSGRTYLSSGLWCSATAINAITLTEYNGQNFEPYSRFALYGIRGA